MFLVHGVLRWSAGTVILNHCKPAGWVDMWPLVTVYKTLPTNSSQSQRVAVTRLLLFPQLQAVPIFHMDNFNTNPPVHTV